MQNARAEASSIAASPEIERGFSGHGFSEVVGEFQHHELTLQGGFALAVQDGNEEASFNAPAPWPVLKARLPCSRCGSGTSRAIHMAANGLHLGQRSRRGRRHDSGGDSASAEFSQTVRQVEASQQRYYDLARERRLVRRTYMGLLLLLTMIVLFVTTWLALFLSKIVTRPLVGFGRSYAGNFARASRLSRRCQRGRRNWRPCALVQSHGRRPRSQPQAD